PPVEKKPAEASKFEEAFAEAVASLRSPDLNVKKADEDVQKAERVSGTGNAHQARVQALRAFLTARRKFSGGEVGEAAGELLKIYRAGTLAPELKDGLRVPAVTILLKAAADLRKKDANRPVPPFAQEDDATTVFQFLDAAQALAGAPEELPL